MGNKIKKGKKKMYKFNNACRVSLEALHTHTHTHTIYSLNEILEQGGSREHRDVVILPRDLK